MTPFDVTFSKDGAAAATMLTAGKHFRFDIDGIEDFFSRRLPSPMIDLLRIGMGVYVADRLLRRKRRNQQRHWSRSINLKVGVLEPNLWNTDDIREPLIECLNFLTDDSWNVEFELDDRRKRSHVQQGLFSFGPQTRLCLYSGGLDSAAGLGVQLFNDPATPVIPITVWHQGGQRFTVLRQMRLLRSYCERSDISPLVFKAHLLDSRGPKITEESSQRSRAFLFTVAAASAALLCGASTVEVYESGVGAINLPLMAGMTGSRTTRSTHPEFLRMVSCLISTVCNQPITFSLPFMNNTKGQVVKLLAKNGMDDLARATVSCVSYPLREKRHKQCGVCPACIFRRQAMTVAGISEDKDVYKYDFISPDGASRKIASAQKNCLKAFLMQIVELTHVRSGGRLPDRILRHLLGTSILQSGESAAPYIRLFKSYRQEWIELIQLAHQRGHSWTKLVDSLDALSEGASRASA